MKLTIDTDTVRIDISAHGHFGPHFISVLYLKLLGIKRALNVQISIIEFRQECQLRSGFCDDNRLQIRSGTVEEDRFYTVSNLSELLTIDIYALIYSPGAA